MYMMRIYDERSIRRNAIKTPSEYIYEYMMELHTNYLLKVLCGGFYVET